MPSSSSRRSERTIRSIRQDSPIKSEKSPRKMKKNASRQGIMHVRQYGSGRQQHRYSQNRIFQESPRLKRKKQKVQEEPTDQFVPLSSPRYQFLCSLGPILKRLEALNKYKSKGEELSITGFFKEIMAGNIKFPWNIVEVVLYDHVDNFEHGTLAKHLREFTKEKKKYCCPICLEAPKPARITRCGHIFCYDCLIHSIDIKHETLGKCPYCLEKISLRDVRPAIITESSERMRIGNTITLDLLSMNNNDFIEFDHYQYFGPAKKTNSGKKSNSEKPEIVTTKYEMEEKFEKMKKSDKKIQEISPKSKRRYLHTYNSINSGKSLVSNASKSNVSSKFIIIEDIKPYLNKDLSMLEEKAKDSNEIHELPYINKAKDRITKRINDWEKREEVCKQKKVSKISNLDELLYGDKDRSFYYRASTGGYIFLDRFDMTMILESVDKDVTLLPTRISAKIVQITPKRITHAYKKRLVENGGKTCLNAIPTNSLVYFISLNPRQLVSKSVREKFADQIEKRTIKQKKLLHQGQQELLSMQRRAESEKIEKSIQDSGYGGYSGIGYGSKQISADTVFSDEDLDPEPIPSDFLGRNPNANIDQHAGLSSWAEVLSGEATPVKSLGELNDEEFPSFNITKKGQVQNQKTYHLFDSELSVIHQDKKKEKRKKQQKSKSASKNKKRGQKKGRQKRKKIDGFSLFAS